MGELPVNYFTTLPWPWCCFQVCKQKTRTHRQKPMTLALLSRAQQKPRTHRLAFIQCGLLFSLLLRSVFPLPPVPARAVDVSHEEDGVPACVDSLSLRHGLQAGRDQATETSLRKLLLLLQQGGSPMPSSLSASPRTLTVGLESDVSPADCSCELNVTRIVWMYFFMHRPHGTYKQ